MGDNTPAIRRWQQPARASRRHLAPTPITGQRCSLGEYGSAAEPEGMMRVVSRAHPFDGASGEGGSVAWWDQCRAVWMAGQCHDPASCPVGRSVMSGRVWHGCDATLTCCCQFSHAAARPQTRRGHMTPDRPVTCMSLRQLADGEVDGPLLDALGGLVEPLVLVDLDVPVDAALLAQAGAEARACERVLVGGRTAEPPGEQWNQLLESLDLTMTTVSSGRTACSCVPLRDPAAAARALHAAAIASPQAALALAQVLRATEPLDVRSALNVESFAYSMLLGGAQFRRWLARRPVRLIPEPGPEPAVMAERSGELLRVTLNPPARRNAYSRDIRAG